MLKGRVQGGAQIFSRHANIIVNLGWATASDVLALMDLARTTVFRETGYEMEPGILPVGFLPPIPPPLDPLPYPTQLQTV